MRFSAAMLGVCALGWGAWASAGEPDTSGLYLGFGGGYGEIAGSDLERNFSDGAAEFGGTGDLSLDNDQDVFEVMVGFRLPGFLEFLAVEGGYINFGTYEVSGLIGGSGDDGAITDTDLQGPLGGALGGLGGLLGGLVDGIVGGILSGGAGGPFTFDGDLEVQGAFAGIAAFVPITERLELYGRGGAFFWDVDADVLVADTASRDRFSADESDDGTDEYYGGGVHFKANETWGVNGGWKRFNVDGDDVDAFTLGLSVHVF